MSSELENSGIRVAVGDCSVTERRRWRPPLSNRQNCTCARKTLQTQQGRTHSAGCVRQWFRTAEPLGGRRYENWNTHTVSGMACYRDPIFHVFVHPFVSLPITCNYQNVHVIDTRSFPGATEPPAEFLLRRLRPPGKQTGSHKNWVPLKTWRKMTEVYPYTLKTTYENHFYKTTAAMIVKFKFMQAEMAAIHLYDKERKI